MTWELRPGDYPTFALTKTSATRCREPRSAVEREGRTSLRYSDTAVLSACLSLDYYSLQIRKLQKTAYC